MEKTISSKEIELYDNLWEWEWVDMEKNNPTAKHLEKQINNYIEKLYKENKISSLIDVGCGVGVNLKSIYKNYKKIKIFGTDISKEAISKADKYIGSKKGDIEYITVDISKEKVKNSFDFVLCNQVLEHIDDDVAALNNIYSMTKKYLLITVPSGSYNSTSKVVGHIRHYNKNDLINKVENAGFIIKEVYEWGYPFHSIYKKVLGTLPEEAQKKVGFGEYGFFKKMLSKILYYLFYFNSSRKGENIVIFAEK